MAAHIQLFVLFLALTACLETQFTQGRQLKGSDAKLVSAPRPPPPPELMSSSEVGGVDSFQPTTPGNSPGVGHSFTTMAAPGKTDGFQPTTPGHSPGVGHSIGN